MTSAEYLGVLVVIAALVGVIALTPIGVQVSGGLRQAICSIVGGAGCAAPATAAPAGDPATASGGDGTAGDGTAGDGTAGDGTVPVSGDEGCSGFWCGVGNAARSAGGAVWSTTTGVAGAAWDDVTGVVDVVRDPGVLVDAGKAIWDDPLGVAGQLVIDQETRDAWGEGDYGTSVGRTIWNVGGFVLAATKAAKAGKIGAVAGTVDDWAGVAADARRAADAASDAARAGDAARAVEAAAEARRIADEAAEAARRLGCPLAAPPLGRLGGGGRGLVAMTAPIPRPAIKAAPIKTADPCDGARDAARQADDAADRAADAAAGAGAGRLRIVGTGFSESERAAAEMLADQGKDVVLREATGVGRTSDLLVDGVPYDVYTPTTGNVDRIVSSIASKGSQVRGGGVVLDLSKSPLTAAEVDGILSRVQGVTDQVSDIIVMGG